METNQYGLKKGRKTDSDKVMKYVLLTVSCVAVLIVLLIIAFTVMKSWDSIVENGLDFLFGTTWRPSSGKYGAGSLIVGSLLVTLGAMVFAVPIGLACAIYISEFAHAKARGILKPVVELFSAIPSVVYGFIGIVVFVPVIKAIFPDQQVFSNSWLAASLMLGIMALPTVISVSEDAIHAVPQSYREASQAMGATKWESIVKVVLPAAVSGISTAIILGVGRAIGETMAVLMLCGNAAQIPDPIYNIFSLVSTLTGTIALQLPESVSGSLTQSALFELGVILMVMVLIINICSRTMVRRAKVKIGEAEPKANFLTVLNRKRKGITGPELHAPPKEKRHILPEKYRYMAYSHRSLIMKLFMLLLLFVCVWMFGSLVAGDGICIIAGIVCVIVAAALMEAYGRIKSTQRQKIAHGTLFAVMAFVLVLLIVIIGYILINGIPSLSWDFVTSSYIDGGISGAIVGTLELIAGTALIAFPLGILTGIYLNEYARDTRSTRIIREAIDLLNGTPSIVFGMFGLVLFVTYLGFGYSLIAGWLTLAFMILPVIIRTTEEALRSVPMHLREASRAMGATKWQTIYKVVLPAAMGGVVTGAILAIGRAAGETAPIMLTAAVVMAPNLASSIFDSVMALPLHLYYLAMEVPGSEDQQYATATVLLFIVLIFFVAATLIRNHYNKKVKW